MPTPDRAAAIAALRAPALQFEAERAALTSPASWLMPVAKGLGAGVVTWVLANLVVGPLPSKVLWVLSGINGIGVLATARGLQFVRFTKRFKQVIVAGLVEQLYPQLSYRHDGLFVSHALDHSRLFAITPTSVSEDGIEGKVGQTEITLSEWRHADPNAKGFQGLFLIADFHKHFRGTVRVLPDLAQRALGASGQAQRCAPASPSSWS